MEIKHLYKSKKARYAIGTIVVLGFVLMVFQAGVYLGYHRAIFSAHLGDNYVATFEGSTSTDMWMRMQHRDLPGGYGAVGKVVKVGSSTIVVATPNNVEETVLINANTIIRHFRNTASTTDIQIGNSVIVLGSPNANGEINAGLIRITQ